MNMRNYSYIFKLLFILTVVKLDEFCVTFDH